MRRGKSVGARKVARITKPLLICRLTCGGSRQRTGEGRRQAGERVMGQPSEEFVSQEDDSMLCFSWILVRTCVWIGYLYISPRGRGIGNA